MIIKAKAGDFIKLPKKMKFNGIYFDLIGIQEDQLVFADSDRYYINGKLLVEYAGKSRNNQCNAPKTIFIEHHDLERMKKKCEKYFRNLPEPITYYGSKIAEMDIVKDEDL